MVNDASTCVHEPLEIVREVIGSCGRIPGTWKRYAVALVFNIESMPKQDDYGVMACRNCKALYVDAIPSARDLDNELDEDPYR